MRKQIGATTLFVATTVIPMLIFLLSISLDLTRYYAESEKWQSVLDEGAVYAHRFLPFQADSTAAAQAFLGRYGLATQTVEITVDGDSV